MGQRFDDYLGFQPKITPSKHFSPGVYGTKLEDCKWDKIAD
jgi:hypothetical protein